jgi:hypothetical protein
MSKKKPGRKAPKVPLKEKKRIERERNGIIAGKKAVTR